MSSHFTKLPESNCFRVNHPLRLKKNGMRVMRGLCATGLVGLFSWTMGGAFAEVENAGEPASEAPRTFYVDSGGGADSADGLSKDHAWRTIERVNEASLQPGDTVRFKCGGVWRGPLLPVQGEPGAPISFTSYGIGEKPLILGSLSRSLPGDWVPVQDHIWATPSMEYALGDQVLDLRQGEWTRHQEAGARVRVEQLDTGEGAMIRFSCEDSGNASNHVQAWGPELPVERGTYLMMTFRARSTEPFPLPGMAIMQGGAPWTAFASGAPDEDMGEVGSEWKEYRMLFAVFASSEAGRLHMNLGGTLPKGAVFEFQPIGVFAATCNIADPLSVDVGNIIFGDGKACGWKKWSVEDLNKPFDYYYDAASRRVFLYSQENPATVHASIECAMKRHVIDMSGAHDVVYDGLALKYGAAHGFGGGNTQRLIIRNCDVAYIGGGHQLTRADGHPVRYGNGIEFWGPARDHLVENCRIWEIYDAALTNQSRGDKVHQENILYRNNVIWNSEYSFEYWNNPESAVTRNIRFVNNTCVNAGSGWAHAQRPDQNGSHLMFYSNTADTAGFEVKYNVFCNVTDWGSRYSAGWNVLPDMDYNLWFSERGVMVYWFKEKIKDFSDYRTTTGLDAHSLFASPEFIAPDRGDYRLSRTSPARQIRTDGGAIGAESLWK